MKNRFLKTFLIVFLILLSSVTYSQNWDKYSSVLGERNWNNKVETKPNDCTALTIRLDGEGNYYPNIFIEDKSMKKSDGKLSVWYKNHPLLFDSLLTTNNIQKTEGSIDQLNRAIETNFKHLIDSLSNTRQIIFLIHGYRKQMYDKKDNTLATIDNDSVESKLGSNKLFVEIYWDSKHISMLKGVFGKKGFKMMEASAIPNAKNVGIQLRSLISSINKSEVSIICHSLGAVVANELTFNYSSETNLMNGKQLKTVYLGAAIGYESFRNVALRGIGNYELKTCISYNVDDFVLLKDFGKLVNSSAITYGNTSLGCNYDGDIDKLLNMYKTELPEEYLPIIINMNGRKDHRLSYYVNHSSFDQVNAFLKGQ